MNFSLVTNVDHTALNRSYNNTDSIICCMDHLATADVDSTMLCIYCHISRLRVSYLRPSKECIRCSKTSIIASQTIRYKTGTVKRSRTACSPYIFRFSYPAVCTIHDCISGRRIVIWFRCRCRSWCRIRSWCRCRLWCRRYSSTAIISTA